MIKHYILKTFLHHLIPVDLRLQTSCGSESWTGGAAFSYQAPLWRNQLPFRVQETDTLSTTETMPQTFLFDKACFMDGTDDSSFSHSSASAEDFPWCSKYFPPLPSSLLINWQFCPQLHVINCWSLCSLLFVVCPWTVPAQAPPLWALFCRVLLSHCHQVPAQWGSKGCWTLSVISDCLYLAI